MRTSHSIEQSEERKAQARQEPAKKYKQRVGPAAFVYGKYAQDDPIYSESGPCITNEPLPSDPPEPTKYARGKHPNSHTNAGKRNGATNEGFKIAQWKPGQSGNPSGRPKNDVAREIAKAVFENNKERLYKAFAKAAMKGNAYAFQQLADRAYGKLREVHSVEIGDYRDLSVQGINERIAQLERDLGLDKQIDDAGGVGIAQARVEEACGPQKD